MTNPRRYLTRVVLFLVLTTIVVAALSPVLWNALLHNPALNGLILTVLLLGIVYNIRRVLVLRPEIAWIESFQNYAASFGKRQPPRLVAPIATALGERDRRGRTSLSAMSLRHLLDSLSSRLDESRDIARYQTGLLIFLGLLGTFWGLLQSINSVGAVISGLSIGTGDFVSVFNDMKTGLARPLGGMGTAFSSSLFGLAGSLILGFLDLQASQAQTSFYNDLEEWLSTFTRHGMVEAGGGVSEGPPLPTYVQGLLQQTAENIDRLQQVVARSEDGRGHLVKTLDDLGQHIAHLGDRLHQQQEQIARLAGAQHELAERLGRMHAVGGHALDEASRKHLHNADLHLARLVESDVKGREQLLRELRSEIRLVARTIAVAAGEPQMLRD